MIGFNRQGVITSTITKRISSFSKNENSVSEKINEAISKYKRSNINYPAIVYGRDNEPLAVQDFFNDFKKKHHHARLENVGLKIDEKLKFFGGSVDGVLHCECQNCDNNFILEIKSPFRLKDQSVKKEWHILEYLTKDGRLKTNHTYYFQIQCYLGLFGFRQAYFVVWRKVDFLTITIEFDKQFYDNIYECVRNYYFNYYVKSFL